jgi:hypothetical protein
MDKDKLKQYLMSENTRLYCILDGASVPDLPMKLYEMRPPNVCLMRGKLEPDMMYAAPYLAQMHADTPFTDWVLSESFGKHWGIFVHCRFSLKEMRRHFRALLTVYDEKGNPMLFRFYDPRVIRKFLPTCNGGELKTFFGNNHAFFAEDEENEALLKFEIENDQLKQTEIKP